MLFKILVLILEFLISIVFTILIYPMTLTVLVLIELCFLWFMTGALFLVGFLEIYTEIKKKK